jgi:hypothetical protein
MKAIEPPEQGTITKLGTETDATKNKKFSDCKLLQN